MEAPARRALALLAAFVAWTAMVWAGLWDALDAQVGPGLADAGHVDLWRAVTTVGDLVPMALLTAGAASWAWWRGDRVGAGLAAVLPPAGWGLNRLLKLVVQRPRPDWALVPEDTFAYPSGHTLTSFLLWVCVLAVLLRHAPAPRRRLAVLGSVPAVLVASSRVALGVHHVTDLVGSWLLGLTVLAALPLVTRRLDARWPRRPGTTPPAQGGD